MHVLVFYPLLCANNCHFVCRNLLGVGRGAVSFINELFLSLFCTPEYCDVVILVVVGSRVTVCDYSIIWSVLTCIFAGLFFF